MKTFKDSDVQQQKIRFSQKVFADTIK